MVLSAMQYREFTKGVLCFMNVVQFYGTPVRVISFGPVIKSLPCPAHVFAKFQYALKFETLNKIIAHFTDLFEELLSQVS
jgi:hypothetical protein